MTKTHFKLAGLCMTAIFIAIFSVLALSPSREVKATAPSQSADGCKECHKDHYDLWKISKHGSVPIDCESCHRLAGGEGAHPVELTYSVESQALTCDTCHAEKSREWVSSRHGEIALGCATCHEPHSQQQKVLDDNQLICANCHKQQYENAHDSTHGAAGLSCESCHLGEDSGHTFKATIASCESCHSDIHEAGQLIAAGAAVEPIVVEPAGADAELSTPEPSKAETENKPRPEEEPLVKNNGEGGVKLPSWLLLLAGLLIGGIGAWAVFGREPGTPNPEK